MEVRGKVFVVTGAGRGIGAALCRELAVQGAAVIVVSDRDEQAARRVADATGGFPVACDVSREADIQQLVQTALQEFGRIDVFCSNAGITSPGGLDCPNEIWQRMWEVNVMSRLYAARAVIPVLLQQGGGSLIHTASAAGLLTEIGSAGYSVTKHADVGLAEWLSVTYGRQGIRVSCVCPLGVETEMLDETDPVHRYLQLHAISAEQAAAAMVQGIRDEQFLILPHPEVAEFFRMKVDDHDRWLRGMQRLRQKLTQPESQRSRRVA